MIFRKNDRINTYTVDDLGQLVDENGKPYNFSGKKTAILRSDKTEEIIISYFQGVISKHLDEEGKIIYALEQGTRVEII
ncbi:MAG: hypothetical protein QXJ06_04245 [Candidatus Aenigmatarchaeota archaeon]